MSTDFNPVIGEILDFYIPDKKADWYLLPQLRILYRFLKAHCRQLDTGCEVGFKYSTIPAVYILALHHPTAEGVRACFVDNVAQAIGQEPHVAASTRLHEQPGKSRVVLFLAEYFSSAIAAVDRMVTIAANIGSCGSWHVGYYCSAPSGGKSAQETIVNV